MNEVAPSSVEAQDQTWLRNSPAGAGRPKPSFDAVQDLYHKLSLSNIPSLDGIRAIAISLVILYHFHIPPGVPGPMGVTMFFVISGFLITWLLLKESDKTGTVSLRGFYQRRFLRIFPAFYSYWMICLAVLLIAGAAVPWSEFWSAFLYVSNYYYSFAHPARPFMPFTWSLAVEEQFYLVWPCLFVLFRRDLGKLSRILVVIIASVWVYRCVLSFGFHASLEYLQHSFDTRVDHLMVGALMAVLLRRRVVSSAIGFTCDKTYKPAVTVVLLVTSVIAENLIVQFDYRHTVGYIVEPLLLVTFMIQMVVLGDTRIWRWINWGVTRWVGRLSYSLYLYHFTAARLMAHLLPDVRWRWQILARLFAGLGAACVSYYLIERPFLKLKNRTSPRRLMK